VLVNLNEGISSMREGSVPVSSLGAVSQQPDQILVADAADRLDLHLELPLGLAPAASKANVKLFHSIKNTLSERQKKGEVFCTCCS
jgi:hypothetical protein